MSYLVMAYVVMANIVMAYVVMTYIVMALQLWPWVHAPPVAMAYVIMAYVVMAYVVMAYVVMTYIVMALGSRAACRAHDAARSALYSYGLRSYGIHMAYIVTAITIYGPRWSEAGTRYVVVAHAVIAYVVAAACSAHDGGRPARASANQSIASGRPTPPVGGGRRGWTRSRVSDRTSPG